MSTESMSDKYHIKKLDNEGLNYLTWAVCCQMVLEDLISGPSSILNSLLLFLPFLLSLLPLPHQQTSLRLLGAPEHQEHWEHWENIGPSRSDQEYRFLLRSTQENHDLSGALPPFQAWLGDYGYPRWYIIFASPGAPGVGVFPGVLRNTLEHTLSPLYITLHRKEIA